MSQTPNELTPRHFAALLIIRNIRDVRKRIEELQAESDPTDLFRSQIRVWLERTAEELQAAIDRLRDEDGGG